MRLAQTLPGTPGKIDVIEFFFYRCPHCFALDPLLEAWVHQLPADVAFRRVPVGQQAMLKLHQRMFYTLEAMGALTPAVHAGIFNAFHRQNIEANDEAAVVALVGRLGADTARFKQTFNSSACRPRCRRARSWPRPAAWTTCRRWSSPGAGAPAPAWAPHPASASRSMASRRWQSRTRSSNWREAAKFPDGLRLVPRQQRTVGP